MTSRESDKVELVGADAHLQWRKLIEQAIGACELQLLDGASYLPVSSRPAASSGTPGSDERPVHKATPASWIEAVRAIALEYITKHKAKDLFPSQSDVCGYIEKMAREKKIYGPQGKPVSLSYIQRNAIQGDWWKQNKP